MTERAPSRTAGRAARWVGRIAAPAAALAVYAAMPGGEGGVSDAGRGAAAVGVLMAVLWMTEALPLAVTSLLPIALFPLLRVTSVGGATAPFADKIVFLFMGGFMLALAMERWGLHRRIALLVLRAVGTSPRRLVAGFMIATALVSMWVSNTATALMMLPIGQSVVALVATRDGADGGAGPGARSNFASCVTLAIAYAASIGGLGTLLGTPPNMLLAGQMPELIGREVNFAQWMLLAVPVVAVFLAIAWFVLVFITVPIREKEIHGGREMIDAEIARLGPVSRGEWTVLIIFTLTAAAWVVRGLLASWPEFAEAHPFVVRFDDTAIAITAAVLLFAIPVDARRGEMTLDWETAARLPWGVLLLFGGGLSLAEAVKTSGLDSWMGQQVAGLGGAPPWVVVLGVCALVVFLSELASNTALTAAMLPALAAVSVGLGVDPATLLVCAAMAASCGFMLPAGTPPNAIAYGTGHVTIGRMVRAGFVLDLVGIVLVTLAAYTTIAWTLGAAS